MSGDERPEHQMPLRESGRPAWRRWNLPAFDEWLRKQNKQMFVSRNGHSPRIIVSWGKIVYLLVFVGLTKPPNVNVERKY